ncbi:1-acyl-sn-glycerol-3-phosphate acyltransferase [Actinopolyspora mortivallis]|uniref:lysophospholipid acyltransferase family protein n=1 Tax=Actinopolyspora mortivallis TaxID=33906 RepID=UPI0003807E6D
MSSDGDGVRPARPTPGTLPVGSSPGLRGFARRVGRFGLRAGWRIRLWHGERLPESGPVVLVANHSSLLDGPVLFAVLPRDATFLVKHELFRGPLGWVLRKLGQVPIRRGVADRGALLAASGVLRAGGVVGVFPEGTRQGTMAAAQHGAAWLARSAGARIVPVACRGTARGPSGWRFRPRVDVLVGEPMERPRPGRAGLTAATERIRTELVGLLAELDGSRPERDDPDEDLRGNEA